MVYLSDGTQVFSAHVGRVVPPLAISSLVNDQHLLIIGAWFQGSGIAASPYAGSPHPAPRWIRTRTTGAVVLGGAGLLLWVQYWPAQLESCCARWAKVDLPGSAGRLPFDLVSRRVHRRLAHSSPGGPEMGSPPLFHSHPYSVAENKLCRSLYLTNIPVCF